MAVIYDGVNMLTATGTSSRSRYLDPNSFNHSEVRLSA